MTPSPSADVELVEMSVVHLPAVASLHRRAFRDSALTRLGERVVRRYYGWQLEGPHLCRAVVARTDSRVSGYRLSGSFNGALSGFLAANRRTLVVALLTRPWMMRDPTIRDRVRVAARALARRRQRRRGWAEAGIEADGVVGSHRGAFGVLSIAVDPTCQRSGVGQALLKDAEAFASEHGAQQMHLTVERDNEGAICFYERLGWTKVLSGQVWLRCGLRVGAPSGQRFEGRRIGSHQWPQLPGV